MEDIKRNFLVEYAKQPRTLRDCAETAGSNVVGIFRLRESDPVFDEAVEKMKPVVTRARVSMVEDALFVRCASAKGNPTETIYYLGNMTRGRRDGGVEWRDTRAHEHSGPSGKPIPIESTTRQVITFAGQEIEM
jgi:hypothetical protein